MTVLSIEQLNALDLAEFVAQLGKIYEHSPWIAERAWSARPFASIDHLHTVMQSTLMQATHAEQIELMRAHPELLGRLVAASELTETSRREQAGAGLYQCTDEELARLRVLNRDYREKFGFPFIVAVRGLTSADIAARMAERLENSPTVEFKTCLDEIGRIAHFRLSELIRLLSKP
jgi:2-oxo-4-hydroxy-4-carboxy-5-ureidoimidazoline decarboxylase